MNSAEKTNHISLLYPNREADKAGGNTLSSSVLSDLDVEALIDNIAQSSRERSFIKQIVTNLIDEPEAIRYRQDVFEDLFSLPGLKEKFEELLPLLHNLQQFTPPHQDEHLVYEVTRRLGELEMFLECIDSLDSLFKDWENEIRSEGLKRLKKMIDAVLNERVIHNLREELPEMMKDVRNIKSVSVGINLDNRLRPVEATLLSINSKIYDGSTGSLMNRLFKIKNPKHEWKGIAQLHTVPPSNTVGAGTSSDNSSGRTHPMMVPLFRDLAEVLNRTCRPIAQTLRRYIHINTSFLTDLRRELIFYMGAADLCRTVIETGLPMCRPTILPKQERRCFVKEIFNPNLVFRHLNSGTSASKNVITNDVVFDANRRVFILTGPNRGGKTTYIQSIGLVHIMAQAGFHVPGSFAEISPMDAVYTHFPVKEQPDMQTGRFGEEAQRLNAIFKNATRHSLILLNESLSNTSHSESLYLARDIIKIILFLGARTVFATHLHELASEIETLNEDTGVESKAISMVSQIMKDEAEPAHDGETNFRRTFKIVPGPPAGRSYAQEIASHYGITYDQLKNLLKKRNM